MSGPVANAARGQRDLQWRRDTAAKIVSGWCPCSREDEREEPCQQCYAMTDAILRVCDHVAPASEAGVLHSGGRLLANVLRDYADLIRRQPALSPREVDIVCATLNEAADALRGAPAFESGDQRTFAQVTAPEDSECGEESERGVCGLPEDHEGDHLFIRNVGRMSHGLTGQRDLEAPRLSGRGLA